MSLDHAILGFLEYKPLTGYDLKTVFDMSVRHFWTADQSQIYRTLSRLAENGWAVTEVIEQDDRPDRKVYHITDDGRDELLRWLESSLPSKGEHIAQLIQIFFAGNLSDDQILALFQRLIERRRATLAELRKVRAKAECGSKEPAAARDSFFWMLTLDYGIQMTQASLWWLEHAIKRIERGEHLKGGRNESSCS